MKIILYKTNKAFDKIMDSEGRLSFNPVLLFVSCQTLAEFSSVSGADFICELAVLKTSKGLEQRLACRTCIENFNPLSSFYFYYYYYYILDTYLFSMKEKRKDLGGWGREKIWEEMGLGIILRLYCMKKIYLQLTKV